MYRKGRLEGSGCGLVASNYRPRHGVLGPHFWNTGARFLVLSFQWMAM